MVYEPKTPTVPEAMVELVMFGAAGGLMVTVTVRESVATPDLKPRYVNESDPDTQLFAE